jgi:uncharacterized protein (DUF302 family)
MVEILRKQLNMTFDDAVDHVSKIMEEEGFSILITKAVDQIFAKKLGAKDYPRYTFILACVAKYAKAGLDVSKDVGLLYPCSFVIYEDEGAVYLAHISIMRIAAEIGLAPTDAMQPVIEMTGKGVGRVWS